MIAVATKPTKAPIHANFSPATLANVPTTPIRPFRPRAYSAIISGMLQSKRNVTHAMRNAPAPSSPPLRAAMRGNRQMLPVPTAMPSTLRMRPRREEKRWSPVVRGSWFMVDGSWSSAGGDAKRQEEQ